MNKEDLLKGLNDKQKEAVIYKEGPLLILAGAGSGKTSVLTHRIGFLIEEGVAPWNIAQYKLIDNFSSSIKLKCRGNNYDLLFYHFENLQYLSLKQVNNNVYATWGIDDRLVRFLYKDYLHRIDDTKSFLRNKYGIDVVIKSHPGVTKKEKYKRNYKITYERIKRFILVNLPVRLLKSKNLIIVD